MSAAKDYIPRPNEDFKLFEGYVVTVITPNAAAWNIPQRRSALLTTWSTGYLPLYNAIAIKSIRTQQQVTGPRCVSQGLRVFPPQVPARLCGQ
jgi:hypothetical protein